MKTSVFFLFLGFHFLSFAQNDDYVDQYFELKDKIYVPYIKSASLQPDEWDLSIPIMELGSSKQFILEFDDLTNEIRDYQVQLIHCTPTWEESDMIRNEYISGFQEDNIYQYNYSFNTFQPYVHYEYRFPSDNMSFTLSGNYVIKVYQNFDPEDVVLTKRFMVYQDAVKVTANVHQATLMAQRYSHHEVDFNIDYSGLNVTDPFTEFEVVIRQNDRWDNAITGLKPVFIRENSLIYEYDRENVFAAGNEFRHFDIQALNYYSDRIDSISFRQNSYEVYLFSDEARGSKRYFNRSDINGKRKYGTRLSKAFKTDADYAWVNFYLPYHDPVDNGSIYIFGELTNWQYIPEAKMKYNHDLFRYEGRLQLKQGYYNYEYVYLKQDDPIGDVSLIEGSHYQTENLYSIYVYHKNFNDDYFRLVGFKTISSL